jgi:hypothetical protein
VMILDSGVVGRNSGLGSIRLDAAAATQEWQGAAVACAPGSSTGHSFKMAQHSRSLVTAGNVQHRLLLCSLYYHVDFRHLPKLVFRPLRTAGFSSSEECWYLQW